MEFKKVLISELKPAAYNPRRNLSEKDPEIRGLGTELADAGTGKTGLHRSNGARN